MLSLFFFFWGVGLQTRRRPQVERWIRSIADLHKSKPAVEVQYRRNMPDVDGLMQEWPADFEEALREADLPSPDMDLSTEEYARVLCALMDVPVYESVTESLHVVFSLYMAFKVRARARGMLQPPPPIY